MRTILPKIASLVFALLGVSFIGLAFTSAYLNRVADSLNREFSTNLFGKAPIVSSSDIYISFMTAAIIHAAIGFAFLFYAVFHFRKHQAGPSE